MLNDKWIVILDFIKWGQNDKSALKLNHLARLKYVQVKVILIWLANKLEIYIKKNLMRQGRTSETYGSNFETHNWFKRTIIEDGLLRWDRTRVHISLHAVFNLTHFS